MLGGGAPIPPVRRATRARRSRRSRARRSGTRVEQRGGKALPTLEPFSPFDQAGSTLLEAVTLGVGDALRTDPRVFVYGEDVSDSLNYMRTYILCV